VQKRVLLVEDDKQLLDIFAFAVGREGYQIIRAADGQMGLRLAGERNPDIIVVDLTHTELGTFEGCRSLRESKIETPVVLLLSPAQVNELAALGLWADYVEKPFQMKELLMRIKANTWGTDADAEECLSFGRLVIYPDKSIATKDGELLDLTQREYELLYFFARESGRCISREELLVNVWGYSYTGAMRNVDVIVRRLREKIEDDPANPTIIVTRRGIGYMFSA